MTDPVAQVQSLIREKYLLEREIGRGGMAIVYAATDLRHGRKVAVKILRPEVRQESGLLERFQREIETAARLSHPHILPLYDSGGAGEFLYYVTPYVESESLRQALQRGERLPVARALRIVEQIGSALDYAHVQGVIHRDIKPDNILLHQGEALLADFGIALHYHAHKDRLTQAGVPIGTVAYMSPEQIRGERALSPASDVYSLACVLYEMLTGEPPFTAETPQSVLAKHLVDSPPSARGLRDIPVHLDLALQKALSKMMSDRFQTAGDFAKACAGTLQRRPKSIAVLPFVNLSADPENEYFSDGITEDIIAQLAKVRDIKVISRTSSMRFKQRQAGLRAIAAELGVTTVLDGSVRRAENRVRVAAQLIDAETDQHLWAEHFDRDLTDVFAIQSEVAQKIAQALQAELSPREREQLMMSRVPDAEAYHLHLLGRFYTNKWSASGWARAVELLEGAISRDPLYAAPHATLALSYATRAYMNMLPPKVAFPEAESHARRALDLDSADSDANLALGVVEYWWHWNWNAAFTELERSIELSPGNSFALTLYGALLDTVLRHEESMRYRRRSYDLNPLDPIAAFNLAYGYLIGRDFPAAIRQFERALELDANNAAARYGLGISQTDSGRPTAAIGTFEAGRNCGDTSSTLLGFLGWAYGKAERIQDAKRIRDELLLMEKEGYVSAYHVALVYLSLQQYDEMFTWLERAIEERSTWMVWFHITAGFDAVRRDPRFDELVYCMNLPVEPPHQSAATQL